MIYADLGCLLEKIRSCQNNPEKSYREKKKTKHTPSDYSLFTNCLFDAAKNKLHRYRGKDCMEKFCKDLREHAIKIVDYEKKIIILLMKKISFMKSKKSATYVKKDLLLIMTKSIIK